MMRRLIPVLGCFLILAVWHSLIVPLTQGEDELAHYRYIRFIAQTGRLPVDYAERQQAWYRADWPPLYHLVVGWAVSPLETSRPPLKDVGESPRRRLVGEIFYPRLIIYTEDVSWPWQDGILAWHIGRFISILFSAGTLLFTYWTARLVMDDFFEGPGPAVLAATLLAFTPRFLFSSAMLGDDSLLGLLAAIFIWLAVRLLYREGSAWVYAGMGLALGLSIVIKYSTGLLPLVLIPLVIWRAGQSGRGRLWAGGRLLWSWLFVWIGAGWWFAWIGYHFNTIERDGLLLGLLKPVLAAGPDVSMRRVFAFFGGAEFTGPARPEAIAPGTFWEWAIYLFQTFWGVPVLEKDPLFPWLYLLMLGLVGLALVGLGRLWRRAGSRRRVVIGLLLLIVALLFPFPLLRFFLTRNVLETGQGRHILYPAAQAIPILLMLGWLELGRWRGRFRNLAYSVPLLLVVWSIFQLAYMMRVYPDPLPVRTTTFDPATIAHPLRYDFTGTVRFLGYDHRLEPDRLDLTLFWRAVGLPPESYRVRAQLVDSAGESLFTWLGHPLNGDYPSRAWDKGDTIRDTISLPLAGLPPGSYHIRLGLLREAEPQLIDEIDLPAVAGRLESRLPLAGAVSVGGGTARLWVAENPARHRQTLLLAWTEGISSAWSLVGPDHVPRRPVAVEATHAAFIVGADWPSGDYALQYQADRTAPLFTVANEVRLFALPEEATAQPGWQPVEAVFALPDGQPQMKLRGYMLPRRRLEPGGGLPVQLYWQSIAPVLADTVTFAVLLDDRQQPYGSVDRYPLGFYSPILWAEGEVVFDQFTVPVGPDAPSGIYFLHVGQYRPLDGGPESLPLLHEGRLTGETAVRIGPLKVGGPPPGVTTGQPDPAVWLNQPVGEAITLLGYDQQLLPGQDALRVRLYWQAEGRPAGDYTVFRQLRSVATGQLAAQQDSPPAGGRYPTGLWEAGEVIVDEAVLLLVDEKLSPGLYRLHVGLYSLATGARLPVPGHPANDIPLAPVAIKE